MWRLPIRAVPRAPLCMLESWRSKSTSVGSSGPSTNDEDIEDLERERVLRENFSKKIHAFQEKNGLQSATKAFGFDPNQNPFNKAGGGAGLPSPPRMSSFFFFAMLTLLMLPLLVVLPMRNRMRSLSWQELPLFTSAYYILLSAIASRAQQRKIEKEFRIASNLAPGLSFDQFMQQQYPTIFQGYHASQQEIVAVVATCVLRENNLNFLRVISKSAGMARDPKKAVDNVLDALRKAYPNNF